MFFNISVELNKFILECIKISSLSEFDGLISEIIKKC